MIIDNDTSEPVDYDIDVADGGSGMMDEMATSLAGSFVTGKPRFSLGPGDQLDFDLADVTATTTCRHIFLINQTIGSTQAKTVVELRDAPADMQRVTLRSAVANGETFYRIDLAKS